MSESTVLENPTNPTPTPLANDPAARTETGEIIDRSATPPANEPAPEPKPGSAAPESYTDFSVPEGHTLDAAAIESATPLFRELGLSQDQAQKLVDFYSTQVGKINAENEGYMETLRTQWREELKADKDIGGKLDQVKVEIGRGLDRLPPAVRDNIKAAMDMTGAGDHPAVIKAIHAFASLIGEGTHVSGGGPSPNGQSKTGVASRPSAAQSMYPNLPSR